MLANRDCVVLVHLVFENGGVGILALCHCLFHSRHFDCKSRKITGVTNNIRNNTRSLKLKQVNGIQSSLIVLIAPVLFLL